MLWGDDVLNDDGSVTWNDGTINNLDGSYQYMNGTVYGYDGSI